MNNNQMETQIYITEEDARTSHEENQNTMDSYLASVQLKKEPFNLKEFIFNPVTIVGVAAIIVAILAFVYIT